MLITAAAINFLPDKVPAHYGVTGEPDRWGSKYELFIFPVLILVIIGLFGLFAHLAESETRFSQKKNRPAGKENAAVFRKTAPIIAIIMCVVQIIFIIKACAEGNAKVDNLDIDFNRATSLLMGIMLIAVSNYMPKTRRNSTIGFRCSWSMYNDTTWQKCNRFAAVAMSVAGLCAIVSSAFAKGIGAVLLLLGYVTAALVISMVYAKKIYDEEKQKEQ
ncbi:MAG: SdpI family protein [Ruminococcus sp.]|nr:SdpI family protein [Ruminococcus sp.]